MVTKAARRCRNCQSLQRQLHACQDDLAALQAEHAQLQEQLVQLQLQLATAQKTSATSSKPPSSDLVKPPKPSHHPNGSDQPRQPGGQPGHPRHQRSPFPPEQCNGGIHVHTLSTCPDCGQPLQGCDRLTRIVQQIDIQDVPLTICEHRSCPAFCDHCQQVHYAPLPPHIENGQLLGPHLTTLIAYLKGACHASFSTIRKFLRDVVGVTISRGQLRKVIGKVSDALQQPYEELLAALPRADLLNVDETGHKDKGDKWWTWCLRASLYTLFKIDKRRSADVLLEILGHEFNGLLGCDYYSAYRRFMRESSAKVQFCLAHLIRDVKFLGTLADEGEQAYGQRLCTALAELFAVIHRQETLSAQAFAEQMEEQRRLVLEAALTAVPAGKHSQNLAKRFRQYGESYLRFITTPGLEPTNNLAEQAIRFVVLDRQVTQGTRSEGGRQWCERIWTVMATCVQQGRSVFAYLSEVLAKHFRNEAIPSLLAAEN
jgi:transposase